MLQTGTILRTTSSRRGRGGGCGGGGGRGRGGAGGVVCVESRLGTCSW